MRGIVLCAECTPHICGVRPVAGSTWGPPWRSSRAPPAIESWDRRTYSTRVLEKVFAPSGDARLPLLALLTPAILAPVKRGAVRSGARLQMMAP